MGAGTLHQRFWMRWHMDKDTRADTQVTMANASLKPHKYTFMQHPPLSACKQQKNLKRGGKDGRHAEGLWGGMSPQCSGPIREEKVSESRHAGGGGGRGGGCRPTRQSQSDVVKRKKNREKSWRSQSKNWLATRGRGLFKCKSSPTAFIRYWFSLDVYG